MESKCWFAWMESRCGARMGFECWLQWFSEVKEDLTQLNRCLRFKVIGVLLKCLYQTLLAFPLWWPACHPFLHLESTFRCAHPSLCPLCYPTEQFGLEDGVSRRWCFLNTVSMLGQCTLGQLPKGMETLLCWNSDVILCLDPLVIFYICNRFCNKHCNVSFCCRMYE